MEVRMKVSDFSGDYLNKNIPRKKSSVYKTSASKTYKPSRDVL